MRAVLLVLLLVLVSGCGGPPAEVGEDVDPADCTGHRHVTFAVAVPDADGNLQRLDLAAPRADNGNTYYQLNVAPKQTVSVHMHQSGPEAGTPELQASQMHNESPDADCVTVARTLDAIDVDATASKLTVGGRHELKGTWSNGEGGAVHVFLQQPAAGEEGRCDWLWLEQDASAALRHVLANGESFLVLYGDPAAGNVAALESGIPEPIGRPSADCT